MKSQRISRVCAEEDFHAATVLRMRAFCLSRRLEGGIKTSHEWRRELDDEYN